MRKLVQAVEEAPQYCVAKLCELACALHLPAAQLECAGPHLRRHPPPRASASCAARCAAAAQACQRRCHSAPAEAWSAAPLALPVGAAACSARRSRRFPERCWPAAGSGALASTQRHVAAAAQAPAAQPAAWQGAGRANSRQAVSPANLPLLYRWGAPSCRLRSPHAKKCHPPHEKSLRVCQVFFFTLQGWVQEAIWR